MKEKIKELIKELENNIKELDVEIKAKSRELTKLHLIIIELKTILKDEEK